MGELLLMGVGTYLGIMVVVWAINSVFADGGVLGLLGLIIWAFFAIWIARETYSDKK